MSIWPPLSSRTASRATKIPNQCTPLDVFITAALVDSGGHRALSGYTRIGQDFYQISFPIPALDSGPQWESFRDALVRGEHPLGATDNRSLWSISRAFNLPESLQQEINDALVEAHDRSLDAIG